MNELRAADIRVAEEYEAERDASRRHLAEVKRHRRVVLNEAIALVFENAETIRGVVEEVVRTEHLRGSEEIASEVSAFSPMVPAAGELSACLYVEISDAADLAQRARELRGVESAVWLSVDGERVVCTADEVDAEADAPAMYHLRFALTEPQRQAWRGGAGVVVGCDHPSCAARVELSEAQRQALAADL